MPLIPKFTAGATTPAGEGGTRSMTQPAKGQEPSMEEILASIRRIIADDEPANETTESRQENVARESAAQAPPRPSAAPSYAAPAHTAPTSPPPRIAPADAAASTPPMSEA